MMLNREQVSELIEYVDEKLADRVCDSTLKYARKWLEGRDLDVESCVKWLNKNGAYCDCEVLFNLDSLA